MSQGTIFKRFCVVIFYGYGGEYITMFFVTGQITPLEKVIRSICVNTGKLAVKRYMVPNNIATCRVLFLGKSFEILRKKKKNIKNISNVFSIIDGKDLNKVVQANKSYPNIKGTKRGGKNH